MYSERVDERVWLYVKMSVEIRREYPDLTGYIGHESRPISFVTVQFSGDYDHNICRSDAVNKPRHQFITVDNVANLRYHNLGQAINAGVNRAVHETIVVVHEDVLLPPGWDGKFEQALSELESVDPNWGILGVYGWDVDIKPTGHVSDPQSYRDHLQAQNFAQVVKLDEQLLVFRKSNTLRLDDNLPSIHLIGEDLIRNANVLGQNAYVINAPCIHKYADECGNLIQSRGDSPKIVNRQTFTFRAELESTHEYYLDKWGLSPACETLEQVLGSDKQLIIFLSRGGSGSRLLSELAQDLNIDMGSELNGSGDSIPMVLAIYKAIFKINRFPSSCDPEKQSVRGLHYAARNLLSQIGNSMFWGFKLPEAMLIPDLLVQAFPNAKFIHMVRDPLATCLRRTHMTARLDNEIGRVTLPLAYEANGLSASQILTDSPAKHMAYTTVHQLQQVFDSSKLHLGSNLFEIRFEDICEAPASVAANVASWLGVKVSGANLQDSIDISRAANPSVTYDDAVCKDVEQILKPIRLRLGYTSE
ncbi:sulfotransferase family protein [Arenicella xantha]|uniref:Sulfotransferase family protein n=1 Tax=Arenicella xantha TaxID=644221 RepID=A0A395JMZ5_9GAMM|nr:sulfotransferase [Arenicella xantha]RBP50988.1 sulfotransferase family protein [Arenicella xantha]